MELKKNTKVEFIRTADGVNPDMVSREFPAGTKGVVTHIPVYNSRGQVEVRITSRVFGPYPEKFRHVMVARDALRAEGGEQC